MSFFIVFNKITRVTNQAKWCVKIEKQNGEKLRERGCLKIEYKNPNDNLMWQTIQGLVVFILN